MRRNGTGDTGYGTRTMRASAALLLVLLAAPLAADSSDDSSRDEFKRTFEKTLALKPGQKLRIEHSNGAIKIRTQREPQVSISAVIRVSSSDVEGDTLGYAASGLPPGVSIEVSTTPSDPDSGPLAAPVKSPLEIALDFVPL